MRSPLGSYADLQVLKVEVNRLIDRLIKGTPSPTTEWRPPVDLLESGSGFVLQIGVPGVAARDLEVSLHPDRIEVRGRKDRLASEPQARRFYLMERFIGHFQVAVGLPTEVDSSRVRATLGEGVLTVHLPRAASRAHRPITINVSEEEDDHE